MPNPKLRQKTEFKSGLHKQEPKSRFPFGATSSLCILVLALGILLLLHYLSQQFLSQVSPIFPSSPKSEAVNSAAKAFDDSRACQSLRSAVVTIYAESEVGSGSIIDLKHYSSIESASSFILTNSHVISPAKDGQVHVAIASKIFSTGQVIATDLDNDLAIVRLNVQKDSVHKAVSLADSTHKPQAGQAACTVGNPFNRPGIVTGGKVIGERGDNDIKLDLYISPGNSGGPLIDANGKVIGVIKSAFYLPTGKNSGISFATNLATINRFIQQNISKIALSSQSPVSPTPSDLPVERPINFNLNTPSPDASDASDANSEPSPSSEFRYGIDVDKDLTIVLVNPDSPAEKAGLTGGDRIISLNSNPVKNLAELQSLLDQHLVSVEFTIERYQEHQQQKILVRL